MNGSSFLHDFHSSFGMDRHGSIFKSSVMFLACGYTTEHGLLDFTSHDVREPSRCEHMNCLPS